MQTFKWSWYRPIYSCSVNVPVYIDGPCNEWWEYYDGPNNAYLVDTNGVVFVYHNWFSNSNPPNGIATNIWCDVDSLLGVNSGNCNPVTGLTGSFDFQMKGSSTEYGPPGAILDLFGEFINTSSDGVEIFIRRVLNDMPSPSWTSSMCVTVCLPPTQDTVSVIVPAGDTIDFSMHFFTDPLMLSSDTGKVRVRFSNKNGTQQAVFQQYRGITQYITNISETKEEDQLKIYPNPTSGILRIESSDFIEEMIIYTSGGRIIKQLIQPNGDIDISEAEPGIYFIKIIREGELKTLAVVKK